MAETTSPKPWVDGPFELISSNLVGAEVTTRPVTTTHGSKLTPNC